MGDTDTLHGTLPSSMTVEPEQPTREHLAERLSVLERELAQAKRTILSLECERDEATTPATFPGPQFELEQLRKDFDRVRAWYVDAVADRDKAYANYCKVRDERDELLVELKQHLEGETFPSQPDGKPFTLAGSMAHVAGLERERDELKHELDICKAERDEAVDARERKQAQLEAVEVGRAIPAVPVTPKASKPRPDLIPAEALLEAGACMAGGLERDDPNGPPWYETAPPGEARRKYRRSMLRHVLAWYAGDKVDGDSGRSPLAHIICNAAILYWLERRK